MKAGDLTELITIERFTSARDAAGQPIKTWTKVADEWASMRQTTGLETIRAGVETAVGKASFRIRWREGYDSGMRVRHNGAVWELISVVPDRVGRQHVDLVCKEVT